MLTNRFEEQSPINAVEVALDVDIEHPVVPPAPLAGLPDCIDGRAAWSISIGVIMGSRIGSRYRLTTSWATATVGIPSCRSPPPPGFGIITRRTGGGK